MPKISVIVPVYNVEQYLRRCVDSILAQTFKDFELILVDDGSTDNSGNICDEYVKYDKRITVVHQSNSGQAAARNNAISISRSEWICFVDADDLIHPQTLEILYNAVINCNANISLCAECEGTCVPCDFCNEVSAESVSYENFIVDEKYLENLYMNGGRSYGVVWGKLIRKSIIQQIPFENGRIFEDIAICCQWLHIAQKVVKVDIPLYFYYYNKNGTIRSAFSEKSLDNLWALNITLQFYKLNNYFKMLTRIYVAYMNISISFLSHISNADNSLLYLRQSIICNMKNTYKNFHTLVTVEDNLDEFIRGILWPIRTKFICSIRHITDTIFKK